MLRFNVRSNTDKSQLSLSVDAGLVVPPGADGTPEFH